MHGGSRLECVELISFIGHLIGALSLIYIHISDHGNYSDFSEVSLN
jgi:hypothetical protein